MDSIFSRATILTVNKTRETQAAYQKLGEFAKRLVGPIDLKDNDVVDENFTDATKVVGKLAGTKTKSLADLCQSQRVLRSCT